jgi:tetratricopeptide (TPR) repeat protein
VFDVTLAKTDLDPQIAHLSEFDVDLALADLLSTNQKTAAEAQSRLLTLEKQHPDNNEVELSMGYLAWQQGNTGEAARHFKLAIDRGLKDPAVIYQYVQLMQGTGPAPEKSEELLRQVLALQPDNLDARLLLASTAANAGHFAIALGALSPVHRVDAEHAYDFFRITAFVHAQLRDYSGATTNAKEALSYAKTSSQRSEIEDVLAYIESVGTPHIQTASSVESTVHPTVQASRSEIGPIVEHASLPRTQGKIKSFECGQGGSYRLHIQAKNREMIFSMPRDPRDVLMRNTPNAMILFTCGPLSPQDVTVVYKPSVEGQSDGVIAELIY